MVQTHSGISQTKTSRKARARVSRNTSGHTGKQVRRCLWCDLSNPRAAQSDYCCKSHMEAASRARKEALIEPLAQFLHHYSERMTADPWGRAVQISYGQAARKAAECIEVNYVGFKYRMLALGYVYDERRRRWHRPALLR